MTDFRIDIIPRDLYYHEVAYVRGLEQRIEALEAALREIATTVSTSREPFLIKLAVIGNVARAALDKEKK